MDTMSKETTCSLCNNVIIYTTKKPKQCSDCKTKKKESKPKSEKKKSRRPKNKNTNGETYLFRTLDECLVGVPYINHGYYSFLMSPKGYPMQLDRYYPTLKLAFEYQGSQHYEYSKYISRTEEKFRYYKECDELKKELCKKKGVTLVEISYKDKITVDFLQIDILKRNPALYERLFGGE